MDRPILFSVPMVRAILAGTKTQTRRVVKPQPPTWAKHYWGAQGTYSGVAEPRHYWANYPTSEQAFDADADFDIWPGRDKSDAAPSDEDIFGGGGFESPFGSEANCIKAAARLWVREAWRAELTWDSIKPSEIPTEAALWYEADGQHRDNGRGHKFVGKLRPGMFMPRWASRITLEVTGVRVERLQDISEADAEAEGSRAWAAEQDTPVRDLDEARLQFRGLWTAVNGGESWDANPWVWVVEFKRVA